MVLLLSGGKSSCVLYEKIIFFFGNDKNSVKHKSRFFWFSFMYQNIKMMSYARQVTKMEAIIPPSKTHTKNKRKEIVILDKSKSLESLFCVEDHTIAGLIGDN